MFNAWFLKNVARTPGEEEGAQISALVRYERTKGVAPKHLIEAVHRAVRRICEVSSWDAYFDIPRPPARGSLGAVPLASAERAEFFPEGLSQTGQVSKPRQACQE